MSSSGVRIHEEQQVTSVRSNSYTFTWTLNDFSVWWTKVSGQQRSLKFPAGAEDKVQWVIIFWPKFDANFCGLFLQAVGHGKSNFEVRLEFAMEDSRRDTIIRRSLTREMDWAEGWGWEKFIESEELLEAIKPADQLYIVCRMTTFEEIVHEAIDGSLPEMLPSSLSLDLATLVDDEKFGDVTIQIDGQRFLAYKGILSARSAVFAAMFEHPMQESEENSVTISDIEPEVFEELLRYIYTDELTCLETMAPRLYQVADKYAIATLKCVCRNYILKQISYETVADTLVLADMHGDQEMKKHAFRFIGGGEVAKVTKSAGWKKMTRTHPYLVDEAFEALVALVRKK